MRIAKTLQAKANGIVEELRAPIITQEDEKIAEQREGDYHLKSLIGGVIVGVILGCSFIAALVFIANCIMSKV
jgi:hypothetical protein